MHEKVWTIKIIIISSFKVPIQRALGILIQSCTPVRKHNEQLTVHSVKELLRHIQPNKMRPSKETLKVVLSEQI